MDAAHLVSLTDYCITYGIAPEEMEAAFNAAMNSGASILRIGPQWLVITAQDERIPFTAYVAQHRTNTDTETKGN